VLDDPAIGAIEDAGGGEDNAADDPMRMAAGPSMVAISG